MITIELKITTEDREVFECIEFQEASWLGDVNIPNYLIKWKAMTPRALFERPAETEGGNKP